jgi:protein involved in polysaccharide export with SLBB domain
MRLAFVVALLMALGAGSALADETGTTPPAQATIDVTVSGWVQHAGQYTLAAGARLSVALAAAGGRRAEPKTIPIDDMATSAPPANSSWVLLTRTVDGRHTTYQIKTALAPYDIRYDPPLQTGDKIYVQERRELKSPALLKIIATTSV